MQYVVKQIMIDISKNMRLINNDIYKRIFVDNKP